MEANLEAYLDEKGVEYEKFTKQCEEDVIEHYYVLEKFVEFDDEFNFMDFAVDNALLGKNEYVNELLNKLDKNNIKYKVILNISISGGYYFNFNVQCEIEEIIFCVFSDLNYKNIISEYKYRKFIKYNTTIDLDKFESIKRILHDKLGWVEIVEHYRAAIGVVIVQDNDKYTGFENFQEFKEWLAENMPEYLRSDDIKIALKD